MTAKACFLDRDGTLIEERNYLSDPALVALAPGVPEALRLLRAAGYMNVNNEASSSAKLNVSN